VLVNKPAGVTSHDVVQQVRRRVGVRAAGHTGTLDPFATGLLVVLIGRATRLARFVEAQSKTYLATARLGRALDPQACATGENGNMPFPPDGNVLFRICPAIACAFTVAVVGVPMTGRK
jgi:tRNA pseudouridine55 synthase